MAGNKYLSRNKAYAKEEPNRDAKKVYIVCEGSKDEPAYFNYFNGLSSNINIITIPSEGGKTNPISLLRNIEEKIKKGDVLFEMQYEDQIWFVIDTDQWLDHGHIANLRQEVIIKNNEVRAGHTDYPNSFFIAQSNPSFEVWLYYHFNEAKPRIEEVDSYDSFKAFVNNKIKGGFDFRKYPVKIQGAIQNAQQNFEADIDNYPNQFSTEVFRLGQIIVAFTKHKLDQIRSQNESS